MTKSQLTREELFPLVYDELRRLATTHLAREPAGHTLQTTALVNETWLRIVGSAERDFDLRGFYAYAAHTMRLVLVDHARARTARKRGGGESAVELDQVPAKDTSFDLIALNEALDRLATDAPHHAQVVELRVFGGLTLQETAEVMGLSARTVDHHWRFAKAWLHRELGRSARDSE